MWLFAALTASVSILLVNGWQVPSLAHYKSDILVYVCVQCSPPPQIMSWNIPWDHSQRLNTLITVII